MSRRKREIKSEMTECTFRPKLIPDAFRPRHDPPRVLQRRQAEREAWIRSKKNQRPHAVHPRGELILTAADHYGSRFRHGHGVGTTAHSGFAVGAVRRPLGRSIGANWTISTRPEQRAKRRMARLEARGAVLPVPGKSEALSPRASERDGNQRIIVGHSRRGAMSGFHARLAPRGHAAPAAADIDPRSPLHHALRVHEPTVVPTPDRPQPTGRGAAVSPVRVNGQRWPPNDYERGRRRRQRERGGEAIAFRGPAPVPRASETLPPRRRQDALRARPATPALLREPDAPWRTAEPAAGPPAHLRLSDPALGSGHLGLGRPASVRADEWSAYWTARAAHERPKRRSRRHVKTRSGLPLPAGPNPVREPGPMTQGDWRPRTSLSPKQYRRVMSSGQAFVL
jgi:hypothetical protein